MLFKYEAASSSLASLFLLTSIFCLPSGRIKVGQLVFKTPSLGERGVVGVRNGALTTEIVHVKDS